EDGGEPRCVAADDFHIGNHVCCTSREESPCGLRHVDLSHPPVIAVSLESLVASKAAKSYGESSLDSSAGYQVGVEPVDRRLVHRVQVLLCEIADLVTLDTNDTVLEPVMARRHSRPLDE